MPPEFIPIVTLLVVASVVGLLMLLMVADKGRRGSVLIELADKLGLAYRSYASVSSRILDAHFVLLDLGQFRHFRHLLEGSSPDGLYINLFDYSLVTPAGASTQTLLLMACPLPGISRFAINRERWLEEDTFSETHHHPLQALRPDQKPGVLERWQLASDSPAALWRLLKPEVCDWLTEHPHLHIEWSGGILLCYRPQLVLEPEQIITALEHGQELIHRLQASNNQH